MASITFMMPGLNQPVDCNATEPVPRFSIQFPSISGNVGT